MCVCVCVCVCESKNKHTPYIHVCIYLPTLLPKQDVKQCQFLSRVKHVWNQSFSSPRLVAEQKLKNPVDPTGRRVITFIPFLRLLVLRKMQSASSRFWTRIAESISYDDNHYTIGSTICVPVCVCMYVWRNRKISTPYIYIYIYIYI